MVEVVVVVPSVGARPGIGAGAGAGPGTGAGAGTAVEAVREAGSGVGAGPGVGTDDFGERKLQPRGQLNPGAGVVAVAVNTVAFVEPQTRVSAATEAAGMGVPGPLPESGVVGVHIPSGLTPGGKGMCGLGAGVVAPRLVNGPVWGS